MKQLLPKRRKGVSSRLPHCSFSVFSVAIMCGLCLGALFSPAFGDADKALSNETRALNIPAPTPPEAPKAPVVKDSGVSGSADATTPLPGYIPPPEPQTVQRAGYVSPEELARFTQNANAIWHRIQRAYPDFVADLEIKQSKDGLAAYLKPLTGALILLADPKNRHDDALWNNPSIADTLQNLQAAPYTRGEGGRYPKAGFNPGRARNTALLKALYGQSPEEVRAACETVDFLGQKVPFNSRHGAAAALHRVAQRLTAWLDEHPSDREWILPCAGTYANRQVAGSEALSAHAFAVAIDLSTAKSPYWRWRPSPEALQNARDRFPQGIVDAFEAEHFVWGGKWHAYDFMHFEYRPEILE